MKLSSDTWFALKVWAVCSALGSVAIYVIAQIGLKLIML